MMSPILHDMVAITGLLVDGNKVLYLHDVLDTDLDFQVNKKNNAYSTFINAFNKGGGPINGVEHRVFILF